MKNGNQVSVKGINELGAIAAANPANIKAQYEARRAADEAYKAERLKVAKAIAEYLKEAPEGTMILNSDIARMMGISDSHAASLMHTDAYNYGVRPDSITVTKRYAEIDENGQVIENGEGLTITKRRATWRKANSRGW